MTTIEQIFGTGPELDALQMSARAFVLFFLMLILIRATGMRAFGRKSSFDTIIVITLGALLSRVVVGVSPALPVIAASTVLCVLHRAIAMLTAFAPSIERLLKGKQRVIYRGGVFDLDAMHRAGISRADVEEAVRSHANRLKLADVLEVHLESSGDLSVVEDLVGEARRAQRITNEKQPA